MSKESPTSERRTYRKRRRAQHEAETRLRITEAAVDLHGSIGPSRTTISAVAERAGVQRGTVYRHFRDEEALFHACSSHWFAQHPLPDHAAWRRIEDQDERLRTALRELYGWYGRGESMLDRTTRDAPLVPAMQPITEAFADWLDAAADAVVGGRPERGTRRRRLRAVVAHSLSFGTWRSLVREQPVSEAEAIDLMAELAEAAAQN
jgi:AcrR family transcriptional regulator